MRHTPDRALLTVPIVVFELGPCGVVSSGGSGTGWPLLPLWFLTLVFLPDGKIITKHLLWGVKYL